MASKRTPYMPLSKDGAAGPSTSRDHRTSRQVTRETHPATSTDNHTHPNALRSNPLPSHIRNPTAPSAPPETPWNPTASRPVKPPLTRKEARVKGTCRQVRRQARHLVHTTTDAARASKRVVAECAARAGARSEEMLFDFAEAGVEAGGRLHDLGTDFAAGTVEKADHGVDGLITFTDASVETCKDMSYLGKRLHGKAMERCRRVELVIGGIAHATRHGAEAAGRAYAAHREHENALRVQARLRAGRCSRMSEGVAK